MKPFLPNSPLVKTGGESGMSISSAPWGSALVLAISYAYIKMLGTEGLRASTEIAILNANYLKCQLTDYYDIKFTNKKGYVAHEFIIDLSKYKKYGITENDIAKRMIDYHFHQLIQELHLLSLHLHLLR